MEHIFVYYQVPAEHRNQAHALVVQMQTRIANRCGQRGRLMKRPEPNAAGHETWMEVYENVSPAAAAMLQALQAEPELAELIEGPRHTERFIDH